MAAKWWAYVMRHSRDARPKDIALALDIHSSAVGRWNPDATDTTRPDADYVVKFARVYKRPPVEALIAASYLNPDDVGGSKTVVELVDSLSASTADELLREIRRRIPEDGQTTAADTDHLGEGYLDDLGHSDTARSDRLKQGRKRA